MEFVIGLRQIGEFEKIKSNPYITFTNTDSGVFPCTSVYNILNACDASFPSESNSAWHLDLDIRISNRKKKGIRLFRQCIRASDDQNHAVIGHFRQ